VLELPTSMAKSMVFLDFREGSLRVELFGFERKGQIQGSLRSAPDEDAVRRFG